MSDTLAVLQSIDATLKELLALSRQRKGSGGAPAQAVASDADLDGQYGNGPVKFNPRDWTGASCKGLPYSECPPEFLDMMAETNDYFAQKADEGNEQTASGKPVAPFKRKEAARCRGWAARIRSGKYKPVEKENDWA